ncbi:helix-turn-helix domain-containing protein [Roseibium alexandrii]|jgi:transcriptional regulator with XRE-family HTH domain|uniref:Helix-turn-helix n=2 Tax=Roseibium alexandrii TaxID=388408 RepID=A0A0M7AQI8_9HYPH|nr:helix-turn-helix domain-containing protein [Roseibium alexandrii]EEE43536.1 helix-turn-helix protein [Roseibium alexandrii DFL-11]CTQ75844.1 Helix-turn-helix [Roseibium alexandrii]
MDKRDRAELFRERLSAALRERELNRSDLARAAELDRSTVSQLLSEESPRLPNGQALAAIASALGVSADWLLGLSTHKGAAADILDQAVQMAETERHPVDVHLLAWYRDAVGAKIRHVPANLPDVLKTEAVLAHEYAGETFRTPGQAITGTRDQQALLNRAESDMEICVSKEALEAFARGEGMWSDLPDAARQEQLMVMGETLDRFYPSLRLHLFGANDRFSAPFTVFGQKWAALYLGQRYLTFSNTRHVQLFSRHFDDLVRHALVRSHEASDFATKLSRGI